MSKPIDEQRGDVVVRVGQIWADNSPRCEGRTVEVIEVGLTKVRRVRSPHVLDGSRFGRIETQEPAVRVRSVTAPKNVTHPVAETVILLERFRPTRTGYRLVRDVEAAS